MSNLINLKKQLEQRNKILHTVKFGEETIFEIRNNFFIGGIFQDVLSEEQIKRMQKAKTEKARSEITKELNVEDLFKSLQSAIFSTYSVEEYKDKLEVITASNNELKTFLNDLLEHYTIEQLYEEQMGYKNMENMDFYRVVLEAVVGNVDKKK